MQVRKISAVNNQPALDVVAHARRQRSRGKNPSMPYKGESNPRKALEMALADLPPKLRPPCFEPKKFVPTPKPAATKMTILVLGHWQKSPATLYGNKHFGRGNFRIKVCRDPKHELKSLGKGGLIYNFH